MGMLVVTALVTFFVQRQELWSIGKKAAVKMAGTAVVDVLAPGLHYEEKENGNHFLAKVEKILFPIADYTVQIKSYETDAESTLSYEGKLWKDRKYTKSGIGCHTGGAGKVPESGCGI